MAVISYDSELMTQHVAAAAIGSQRQFTIKDEAAGPMIISHSTDDKLYAILKDGTGQHALVDLGSLLALDAGYKLSKFSVSQDVNNNDVYLILSTKAAETDDPDTLLVLKPFQPNRATLMGPSADLSSYIIPGEAGSENRPIVDIFMGIPNPNKDYPLVIFTYTALGSLKHQDLSRVNLSKDSKSWSLASDLTMPADADEILVLQPLTIEFNDDPLDMIAVLYTTASEQEIRILSVDGSQNIKPNVDAEIISSARCLGAYTNSEGFSVLLVGGNGLHSIQKHFRNADKITDEAVFASLDSLYTTQSNTKISVWGSSQQHGIGYLIAGVDMASPKPPVMVESEFASFSPFKAIDGQLDQYVLLGSTTGLSLRHHDPISGMWNSTPFYVPATHTNLEIPSYTTQITLTDQYNRPLSNYDAQLGSEAHVSIIANGLPVVSSPDGVAVRSDQYGLITLIIPTSDISTHAFWVSSPVGSRKFKLDPAVKVHRTLGRITCGEDLRNVKLPSHNGEEPTGLLDNTEATDEEIDKAGQAIHDAYNLRKQLTSSKGRRLLRACIAQDDPDNDAGEMLWDAWHWLESHAESAWDWTHKVLADGIHFVVELAGKTYTWVVKGLTQIGKFVSWIFNKVLALSEELVQWLGFLFEWDDILETQKTIIRFTNEAITCAEDYLDTAKAEVDQFFGDLKQKVQDSLGAQFPDTVNNATADGAASKSAMVPSPSNSVQVNWSSYQFSHGGASTASSLTSIDSTATGADPFKDILDLVTSLSAKLKDQILEMAKTIINLFKKGKSLSLKGAWKVLGTMLLLDLIEDIRTIGVGLITVFTDIVRVAKSTINQPVNIPVFSALFHKMTDTDLSVISGLALILAIPITLLLKLVTEKDPPDMTDVTFSGLLAGTTSKQQALDFNFFGGLTGSVANGLAGTLAALPSASMLTDNRSSSRPKVTKRGRGKRSFPVKATNKITPIPRYNLPHPKARLAQCLAGEPDLDIDWGSLFGLVSSTAMIPVNMDTTIPGYGLRWGSWFVSAFGALFGVGVGPSVAIWGKVWSVVGIALGITNFSLCVTYRVDEIKASKDEFPAKDDLYSVEMIVAAVLDLVSTLCGKAANFDPEPETKEMLVGLSYVTMFASIALKVEGTIADRRGEKMCYPSLRPGK